MIGRTAVSGRSVGRSVGQSWALDWMRGLMLGRNLASIGTALIVVDWAADQRATGQRVCKTTTDADND